MATQGRSAAGAEQGVRQAIERFAAALRAKDLNGMLACYAPAIRVFDLAPPLEYDRAAHAQGLAAWFPTWEGPIGYEMRDLAIAASDDLAFAHGLNHLTGKRTSGEHTDVWFRTTMGLRRAGGAWKIVHEHASVPFLMDGSYRAAIDLRPRPG